MLKIEQHPDLKRLSNLDKSYLGQSRFNKADLIVKRFNNRKKTYYLFYSENFKFNSHI